MAVASGRRVTSADVARLAGVSRATVSYVLNDTPRQSISADTRNRVLSAAAKLEYAPSAAARALRTGRSDVVLCLLPDWPIGSEVGSLLASLSTALAREGLTFVVHPGNREDRPIGEIWKTITPAAVIAFDDFSDAEMAAMHAAGVALVVPLLGRGPSGAASVGAVRERRAPEGSAGPRRRRPPEAPRPGAAAYGVNGEGTSMRPQELIGRRQAEHLVAAGHTRLGYAAPDDDRLRIFLEPRLAGARAACRAAGLADPAIETVALDVTQAGHAVRRWHAQGVTAVGAYNDEVALAVLAGVRAVCAPAPADAGAVGRSAPAAGYRLVPGNAGGGGLAVIGVDDIPAARLASPALTTVTTDQDAVAAHLAATVVAAVGGQHPPSLPVADLVRVVVRESA